MKLCLLSPTEPIRCKGQPRKILMEGRTHALILRQTDKLASEPPFHPGAPASRATEASNLTQLNGCIQRPPWPSARHPIIRAVRFAAPSDEGDSNLMHCREGGGGGDLARPTPRPPGFHRVSRARLGLCRSSASSCASQIYDTEIEQNRWGYSGRRKARMACNHPREPGVVCVRVSAGMNPLARRGVV